VLFAQLVDDPSAWPDRFPTEEAQDVERERLHKVIADMVPWEASNNERIFNVARWEIARSVAWGLGEEPPPQGDTKAILDYLQTKAPPVYDPFSGGGSIPLEAQRLGLRAYGSDLNPVAVLIGKALVEIPPKFAGQPPVNPKAQAELKRGAWNGKGAQGLAEDVRYYGQWMRDEAEKRIGHLYPKATLPDGSEATVIAWLWARTVRSPDPAAKGAMVPLVSSFMLSTKEGKKTWVEPVIDASAPDGWRFEVHSGGLAKVDEQRLSKGTKAGRGSNFSCVLTGSAISPDHVKAEGTAGRMGARLMAIVAESARGRTYIAPTVAHEAAATNIPAAENSDVLISTHPQYMGCVGYGLTTVQKLFSARQFFALTTFSELVVEARQQALVDARAAKDTTDCSLLYQGGTGAAAYADAVATYLAFGVSKMSDYNSTIVLWSPTRDQAKSTFARQALPMVWDYSEINPLAGAAGDLFVSLTGISRTLADLPTVSNGAIYNINATQNSFPVRPIAVSTDPPYYDNIPYADLSDYFYYWLRLALQNVWPDLFRRLSVPKQEELVADVKRHGGRQAAETFFMGGMGHALSAMREASTDQEPLTIYYAFKQSDIAQDGITSAGWASFLQSVVDSNLVIDGTWPMRTERGARTRSIDSNALASSIVLVCRKRPADTATITRADFIRLLKRELPDAIEDIRKAGVAPVDMQQSVIGPGMGIFSRHARVLEDDDSAMSVKTTLAIINRVWGEIENEADAALDAETQVALAWYASFGFDAKPSGDLITLANAKNVPQATLFASGVFTDLKGRAALTPRDSLPNDWSPSKDKHLTVWECVQHTARALNAVDGGTETAAQFIAEMGASSADARKLVYRLFEIATQKGWSAEALVYNELAEEWGKLEDQASAIADPARAGEAQLGLI